MDDDGRVETWLWATVFVGVVARIVLWLIHNVGTVAR